ncbi:MAG: class I SAM-dependent methyltransferase [Actinomycetota bacterium]|nr:class I SAM-dependent methyltransferase [Actinomycetota bacterium]
MRSELEQANARRRRAWAKQAPRYDKSIGFFERRIFGTEHRGWACDQAVGRTLEVAVGTGLNIPLYPADVELVGIDLTPEMLELARRRASESGRQVDLQVGDAHCLSFDDQTFDTVVCTYSLCNIPDPRLGLAEMCRVLKEGGRVVLVDHIRSNSKPVLWIQKAIEFFSRRLEGEHMTRRPSELLPVAGLVADQRERLGPAGMIERVVARRSS